MHPTRHPAASALRSASLRRADQPAIHGRPQRPQQGLQQGPAAIAQAEHARLVQGDARSAESDGDEDLPEMMTRSQVEAQLSQARQAPAGSLESVDMAALAAVARSFPDIAQGEEAQIPAWAQPYLRQATQAHRYIFVPALAKAGEEDSGLYHVAALHGGERLLVARVTRFNRKLYHNPYTLTPAENDAVVAVYHGVSAFLKDPVGFDPRQPVQPALAPVSATSAEPRPTVTTRKRRAGP